MKDGVATTIFPQRGCDPQTMTLRLLLLCPRTILVFKDSLANSTLLRDNPNGYSGLRVLMLRTNHMRWVVGLIPSLVFVAVLGAVAGTRHVLGYIHPRQILSSPSVVNTFSPEFFSNDFLYRTFCTVSLACFTLCLAVVIVGSIFTMWRYSSTRRIFCIVLVLSVLGSVVTFLAIRLENVLFMPCESLNCIWFSQFTAAHVITNLAEAGIASFAFLLGASGLLLVPTNPADMRAVEKLARRIRHLRWLLFMGALVLLVNTATIVIFYGWAASLVSDNNDANFALSAATATSVITGAIYSLLLIALYTPSALLLQWRARRLGESQGEQNLAGDELHEWLVKNGLEAQMLGILKRLALILAPVLAGSVIPVVGKLLR